LTITDNSNHCTTLKTALESLCVEFGVILLPEIWTYNVEFYQNILPGYILCYELSIVSIIGSVGIYVKKSVCQNTTSKYVDCY